ncbi:YSC84-like protein [Fusarium sp. NRRL 52700]|nr:YSC84-like protein [Fusarium sp. NRRL 52700]
MASYNNNVFELPANEAYNTRPAGYDFKNTYFPPPPSYTANSPSIQQQSTEAQINRKSGFANRIHVLSAKIAGPVNNFANKLGCEAFMPTTMEKECEKAARVLASFCEGTPLPPNESLSRRKALVKIPRQVLQSAAGLAIFTAFRSGAQFTWGSGSGVVVARRPDGSWSPPSSFAVNTLSVGFMVAMDIFDCVCVLRTPEAVAAFTKSRVSFGGEVAVTAGPVGTGVYVDSAVSSDGAAEPIWSYMKSRGLYVGAQIDGTVITTRDKANEDFYGVEVPVASILRGEVPARGLMWPEGYWKLNNVLREIDYGR